MRIARALVVPALLAGGCTMNFGVFEGAPDASSMHEGGADGTASGDAPSSSSSGSSSSGASSGDASHPGDAASSSGASSSGSDATAGDASVACSGATPIECMVCADGGPPVFTCVAADTKGFCLDGTYAHCSCQQDTDCPGDTMRCSNNVCTSCGEPLFSHNRCNGGGNCCKTGATVGQCSC